MEEKLHYYFHAALPKREGIIVAAIPDRTDSTHIRTEFIAFLAATQAYTRLNSPRIVAFAGGFTLHRMAEQCIPTSDSQTEWLSLVQRQADVGRSNVHSANEVVLTMATRHPGSKALSMPYINESSSDEDKNRARLISDKLLYTDAAFVTVSGPGERNRNPEFHYEKSEGSRSDVFPRPFDTLDTNERVEAEFLGLALHDTTGVSRDGRFYSQTTYPAHQVDIRLLQRVTSGALVWIVAARKYKARPVLMALRNRLANALVIDDEIAEYLINHADA